METFKYYDVYGISMEAEHKHLILGIVAILSVFTLLSTVSALTWVNPTTGQTVKGTITFNVTSVPNVLNCTFKTSAETFGYIANTTANQPTMAVSNNTALLTQTASTTLNATCTNATTKDSDIITIGIDNNAPTCSFSIDYDDRPYMSAIGVSTTQGSTDDLTTLTYAWTLWDPSGAVKTTKTTSTPTFAGSDFDQIGDFTLGLTVTDAASGSTACTNKTILIRGSNNGQVPTTVVAVQEQKKTTDLTVLWIGAAVLVIFILAVGGFVVLGKSKGRR